MQPVDLRPGEGGDEQQKQQALLQMRSSSTAVHKAGWNTPISTLLVSCPKDCCIHIAGAAHCRPSGHQQVQQRGAASIWHLLVMFSQQDAVPSGHADPVVRHAQPRTCQQAKLAADIQAGVCVSERLHTFPAAGSSGSQQHLAIVSLCGLLVDGCCAGVAAVGVRGPSMALTCSYHYSSHVLIPRSSDQLAYIASLLLSATAIHGFPDTP